MNKRIVEHIDKGAVYAIIPARSGSKGVRDKNIRPLFGYPMIAYSIAAAKLSGAANRVIVSTDSEMYAEISRKYGAEAPFLRPENISGDNSTDLEFMQHAINWFYENENHVPEYWTHLRVTCPIGDPAVISKAVSEIKNCRDATCLLSINKADDYLTAYKWLIKDGKKYVKSIFFENNDDANLPRQSYPETYIPNAYVDVLTTQNIVENNSLHGNRMLAFETAKTVDIDTIEDIEKLQSLKRDELSALSPYLNKISKSL